MKRLLCLIPLLLICSCQSKVMNDYRYNPFQFSYSEYYLTAKVVSLPTPKTKIKTNLINLNSHNISFGFNQNNIDTVKVNSDTAHIKSEDKFLGIISVYKEELMGCSSRIKEYKKDFCGAFNSSEEYFKKIFTLTPNDLTKDEYAGIGNQWIIHDKGSFFEDVEKTLIYKKPTLIAFRSDLKESAGKPVKTNLFVFHNKLSPDFIHISFTVLDEELIVSFLNSLEVK